MNTSRNFRLLYFGSDAFSIRVLNNLLKARLCPVQVVTSGHSKLLSFANQNNLVTHRWPLELHTNEPNIGLVASFGHMIEPRIVDIFEHGLYNIHPSLLPCYRGSTPIQAAILAGDQETGCSIMRIPPIMKYDIGDIVLQERLSVKDNEYARDLSNRLADLGGNMFKKFLLNYDKYIALAKPQLSEKSSYAKKIKADMGTLKFKSETSLEIDRKVRAYTGYIDLFTFCSNGLKVKLDSMLSPDEVELFAIDHLILKYLRSNQDIEDVQIVSSPGTMYFHKIRHLLCIKCANNRWLAFEGATPESKARMSALDFYNGYLSNANFNSLSTDI